MPGPAGLVQHALSAAQEHFSAARYTAANAFLELIQRPVTHPAETWLEMGHLHFVLEEYSDAGRAYGYATAYHPSHAGMQVLLAVTCLRLDDIRGFEGYLSRALRLDPVNPAARQVLADLNRDLGRYDEAALIYEELLQIAPGSAENLLALALCRSLLGQRDSAVGLIDQAACVRPPGTYFPPVPAPAPEAGEP